MSPRPTPSREPGSVLSRRAMLGGMAALAAAPGMVGPARSQTDAGAIGTVELACIDPATIVSATFQSHNQKVASCRHGLFATYLQTRNADYTAQTWKLTRSVDGGRTFTVLDQGTTATNPPVIEVDAAGLLYLVRVDFSSGDAYLHRYDVAGSERPSAVVTTIPGAAAGKYAALLDERRGVLYFFSHNNRFSVVGLDGTVLFQTELLKDGPHGALQYPLLSLAEDGTLYAAWTTVKHGVYLYWDIHAMASPDGGKTWRNLDGSGLTPPIVADDAGPTARLSGDDEYEVHTWLSSLLVRGGRLHGMYLAQSQPPRQHLVTYDLADGHRLSDRQPLFRGQRVAIQGLDGFLAADPRDPEVVYAVGSDQGRIAALVSRDRGTTWQDLARTETPHRPYAIGGYRLVTEDGWLVGTFTEQGATEPATAQDSRVMFFRIRAGR